MMMTTKTLVRGPATGNGARQAALDEENPFAH